MEILQLFLHFFYKKVVSDKYWPPQQLLTHTDQILKNVQ